MHFIIQFFPNYICGIQMKSFLQRKFFFEEKKTCKGNRWSTAVHLFLDISLSIILYVGLLYRRKRKIMILYKTIYDDKTAQMLLGAILL